MQFLQVVCAVAVGIGVGRARAVDQVGRVLLVAEVRHTLALLLTERTQDALASVSSWRSQHDSDDWHYVFEIVRAVAGNQPKRRLT
ncbi:MAG: hypothetical protein ACKVIQ_07570 [Acidimicrobiales bacterium]